jgi:hypothetical protein
VRQSSFLCLVGAVMEIAMKGDYRGIGAVNLNQFLSAHCDQVVALHRDVFISVDIFPRIERKNPKQVVVLLDQSVISQSAGTESHIDRRDMIVEGNNGQIAVAQLEFGEHQISATFRTVPVAQLVGDRFIAQLLARPIQRSE